MVAGRAVQIAHLHGAAQHHALLVLVVAVDGQLRAGFELEQHSMVR